MKPNRGPMSLVCCCHGNEISLRQEQKHWIWQINMSVMGFDRIMDRWLPQQVKSAAMPNCITLLNVQWMVLLYCWNELQSLFPIFLTKLLNLFKSRWSKTRFDCWYFLLLYKHHSVHCQQLGFPEHKALVHFVTMCQAHTHHAATGKVYGGDKGGEVSFTQPDPGTGGKIFVVIFSSHTNVVKCIKSFSKPLDITSTFLLKTLFAPWVLSKISNQSSISKCVQWLFSGLSKCSFFVAISN